VSVSAVIAPPGPSISSSSVASAMRVGLAEAAPAVQREGASRTRPRLRRSSGKREEPPMPGIRRLTAEDDAAAEALLRRAFADYVRRLGRAPRDDLDRAAEARAKGGLAMGVEEDGRLLAVATLHPQEEEAGVWLLSHLGVDPDRQGEALGDRLLDAAEAGLAAEGAERLQLVTAAFRDDLVGFYARRGFEIVRRGPPERGEDPHERVRMEKRLA